MDINATGRAPEVETLMWLVLAMAAAGALIVATRWLERATHRPGLALLIAGCLMLVGAGLGFSAGRRLLPALFVIQAVGFLYMARLMWRAAEHHDQRKME